MTVRGQINLPALAIALLALTATAVLALAIADQAFAHADRDPGDRRVAAALAERIVADESPLTDRQNVLQASALGTLDPARLRSAFPVVGERQVRVRVAEWTVERGDPTGGASVRRVVLVRRAQAVELDPALDDGETTLPRRTARVTLTVDPSVDPSVGPGGTTIRTVRANGRVLLHDLGGLDGTYDVRVSRFDTVTLTFEGAGPLPPAAIGITYYPARTTKAVLVVTVDG